MPRVARNVVVFDVDGVCWKATFLHVHSEAGFTDATDPKKVKVKHVTICALISSVFDSSNTMQSGTGESRCSMKDSYRWRFGVKQAFERALASLRITRGHISYGRMMASFFDEMRYKSYPSLSAVTPRVVEGVVVPNIPVIPRHNLLYLTSQIPHGLGYCGAD